ncbi:LuxR C-terminal-related transcriptional regulator [Actinoplanes sp. NPDC051343]|uniref:LuxR C-terminal-related transcriptional regulator n=1 Tax=Actinoplanes sp. NPDC051343 TaxID=3363906 RepID=UPI003789FA83
MAVPMVGRAPALEELRGALDIVRAENRPVTAVLTGAAGTGKSALVGALLQAAGSTTVLSGAARVHSPAPYDWLAAVLAKSDADIPDVPEGALSWLKQDPDVPRERYTPDALLRIAVTTVRALIGTSPAVLVVEDLHALDPASLNLVAELAATDLPALLLVTSQLPEEAVSPQLTARTLARLTGRPGAVRRHLSGLAQAEVGELLRHAYGVEAVTVEITSAVWRRTEGNPYLITELIARLSPAGLRELAAPQTDDLTAREREVLGCIAEGMSNKQIARALEISVRTVTVHVSNLLRKTGAASRTEAALWALERNVRARATS